MKLPLIGLQTNPSGTASSPPSRPSSHPDMALSFRPWATSVDNLVSKGLITSVYTSSNTIATCAQPHCLSQAAHPDPGWRADSFPLDSLGS